MTSQLCLSHYKQLLISFLLICLFNPIQIRLLAQDSTSVPTDPILLLQDNQIVSIDTKKQTAVLITSLPVENFSRNTTDTKRIYTAGLDKTSHFIYLIEASGRDEKGFPTSTSLIQLNLKTGKQKTLLNLKGIFNFSISPDQQRIVVSYFEGDYGWSTQRACILDLTTLNCQHLSLKVGFSIAYWIDNQNYIATTGEHIRIQLINAVTGINTPIELPSEWYAYSVIPIPNTRLLLISGRKRTDVTTPVSFLTFDIDTGNLTELNYKAPNFKDYSTVTSWNFSPDGHYLLYGGTKMALVEFATGRLITEIPLVINSEWEDENNLIVQGSRDGKIQEIIRINAASAQIIQLSTGEGARGILLVP